MVHTNLEMFNSNIVDVEQKECPNEKSEFSNNISPQKSLQIDLFAFD